MARASRLLKELGEAAPGPAEAYLRMLGAVREDVAQAVTRRGSADPFDARDPHYIERTLPALRVWSERYFRADVRGLNTFPPRDRCCSSATTPGGH